jgi:glutathione S-transferase
MLYVTSAEKAAPNPRRVDIFLAEKGVTLPTLSLGLAKREHKEAAHIARYSRGQVPVLELDDGSVLTESVAICRYLESLHPEPPLFGRTPLETARIDMWTRRTELILMSPLAQFWQHAHPFTARLVKQFTEFGESNRDKVTDAMRWIDGEMGAPFLCGSDFTMADIVLFTTLEFSAFVGIPVPDDCTRLTAWFAAVKSRPSVA